MEPLMAVTKFKEKETLWGSLQPIFATSTPWIYPKFVLTMYFCVYKVFSVVFLFSVVLQNICYTIEDRSFLDVI